MDRKEERKFERDMQKEVRKNPDCCPYCKSTTENYVEISEGWVSDELISEKKISCRNCGLEAIAYLSVTRLQITQIPREKIPWYSTLEKDSRILSVDDLIINTEDGSLNISIIFSPDMRLWEFHKVEKICGDAIQKQFPDKNFSYSWDFQFYNLLYEEILKLEKGE